MAARRDSRRPRRTSNGRDEAEQQTRTDGEERQQEERSEEQGDTSQDGSGGGGIFAELKDVASDAALAVLAPVAKKAATQAAKFAVTKGPELMEDKILPKLAESGGPGAIMDGLKEGGGPVGGLLAKVTGGGDDDDGEGRDAGDGTGKGRRMPIQQAVDVAAPIDVVYDQFTLFEEWPKFMHRLERVEQKDDAHVTFHEKVWLWRRSWDAEIVEQRPDERIVWETESGLQHVGVVTFHELAERLTRLEVNIDLDPSGPMEKIARGARFAKRAVRADLKRFKAYVEMHEEADDDGWEGEIEDGEVVDEEAREDEMSAEDEEQLDDEPAEDEDEEQPEDEASVDEDGEPEEEEPKPKPKRRQPARSRSRSSSNGSNGSSKSKAAAPKSRSRGSSSGGTKSRAKSTSGRKR
jgi:uncharacterized membrane protein